MYNWWEVQNYNYNKNGGTKFHKFLITQLNNPG